MTVLEILMKRDGISEQEARDMLRECARELIEGNPYAIQDVLGLEDDYIFDVLDEERSVIA